MLIKVHMSGGDDTMRHRVITTVAFGVSQVTKKDTRNGTWSEFVRGGGCYARVTPTTKDSETVVGRWCAIEEMIRSIVPGERHGRR